MLGETLLTFGLWLKRDAIRKRFNEAYVNHWKAVERGDTRRIKETRQVLLAARTDCLRVGV